MVRATVPRDGLWHAQTPQAFSAPLLRRAHALGAERRIDVTDDAQLVEALGLGAVRVVRCDPWNFKVTEPRDMTAAEALLAARSGGGGTR
ncbi:MAG: 2-C-methyl-D-erythritol 4-phosphate cytidylyltransferase [Planctomycetes bacterium]|nr:2-C-methyl-D-erythritol 4-phosphate cytidylyltransferase [Planctomycetota bacterium]